MIQSNLKSVLARLEAFQAGIPGAVERALDKNYWLPALRAVGEKALRAQFTLFTDVQTRARYEKLLPDILDTITARVRPGTRLFAMSLPAEVLTDVNLAAAAQWASLQWTPTGRARKWAMPDPQAEQNLAASRQAILDWVTYEKQWDDRDAGKTPEEVAERIERILGLRPAMHERNQEMDLAAEDLQGAIEAWLAGAPSTPGGHAVDSPAASPARHQPPRPQGLNNAQARQWLDAVLQTWMIYFRVHLPDRIEAEFKKLRRQVQNRQPQLL
jgi:hypothetical protein